MFPNRSLVSITILLAGLLLSTTAAVFAFRAFDADESQRFSEAVDELHGEFQSRLDFFAGSVKQLAAVYAVNPKLKQKEFIDYTVSTGTGVTDAGLFSYGIYRRDKTNASGADRYFLALRQRGPNAPTSISPLGMDVSKDQDRMTLIQQAIDAGQTVVANGVPALAPTKRLGQIIMAPAFEGNKMPVTVEERREKAIAVAYARFSESGLFDIVLQNAGAYKSHRSFDRALHCRSPRRHDSSGERRTQPGRNVCCRFTEGRSDFRRDSVDAVSALIFCRRRDEIATLRFNLSLWKKRRRETHSTFRVFNSERL